MTNVAIVDELGGAKVGYITGGGGYDDQLIEDFAPTGQNADARPEQEVDILIATDVLGVGQNFQDSRVVVNYDLPWNPMKMEQRIGRVDRITTTHDELLIYNFAPTGELRHRLELLETIRGKMETIEETFGRSAPILEARADDVSESIAILNKVEEGETEYSETDLEGIGSKYDDIRNAVRDFCEIAGLTIEDLRNVLQTDAPQPQLFRKPADEPGILTLVRLEYSDGSEEWKTTIFDRDGLQRREIGGQWIFSQYPRKVTDDADVFMQVQSQETEVHSLANDQKEELEALAEQLSSTAAWENNILSQHDTSSGTIGDIEDVCQQTIDDWEGDIVEMAEEVLDLINNKRVSDYAENELRTIYRKRRRYGLEGTIERLHGRLTGDLILVEPKTVNEAVTVLCGLLEPTADTVDG